MKQELFLGKLEDCLQKQSELLTARIQNLSVAELLKKPSDGGWSIAECLEHLNTYGSYYIPRLEAAIANNTNKTLSGTYKPGLSGKFFNSKIDPDQGKSKMKAHRMHIPVGLENPEAVVALQLSQQEALLACIRKASDCNLNKACIPVSVMKLIRLSVGDVLHFMCLHQERHLRQASRLLPQPPSNQIVSQK